MSVRYKIVLFLRLSKDGRASKLVVDVVCFGLVFFQIKLLKTLWKVCPQTIIPPRRLGVHRVVHHSPNGVFPENKMFRFHWIMSLFPDDIMSSFQRKFVPQTIIPPRF